MPFNMDDFNRQLDRLGDAWAELLLEAAEGNEEERKEAYAMMRNVWHEAIVDRLEADVDTELLQREEDAQHDDTEPEGDDGA